MKSPNFIYASVGNAVSCFTDNMNQAVWSEL
jgi:hypothetical protein